MRKISPITDADHLQEALAAGRHKGWEMMETGHRHHLWTAMVGHYLHQMDAAHRHRPKIRQENLKDRASIPTEDLGGVPVIDGGLMPAP